MFRAILVDDDEISRTLFEKYCSTMQDVQLIGSFSDPRVALEYAKGHPFEFAVLDVIMPKLNGIELARQLKRLLPKLIPIFVTASDQFALDAYRLNAASYIIKPFDLPTVQEAVGRAKCLCFPNFEREKVHIRTFGHFDVFVHNKPIKFFRQKSKEILAYLINRNGGIATVDQIITALWEDQDLQTARASYYAAFKDLRNDLKKSGIEEILISNRNQKSINVDCVDCDYYNFLHGDETALNAYSGHYMTDYSWAEETNAHCTSLKQLYDQQHITFSF